MLRRGPHKSAQTCEAISVLKEETVSKVDAGFARIVCYGHIRDLLPLSLKISPIATVLHKSRRIRWILDLSFQLLWNVKKLLSVNSATEVQSKHQSMTQLGQVLKRIIAVMADVHKADSTSTFKFAKLHIKDGFWCLGVSEEDAWNFCYVLPSLMKVENIKTLFRWDGVSHHHYFVLLLKQVQMLLQPLRMLYHNTNLKQKCLMIHTPTAYLHSNLSTSLKSLLKTTLA